MIFTKWGDPPTISRRNPVGEHMGWRQGQPLACISVSKVATLPHGGVTQVRNAQLL